jgi:hypothetical protein
MFDALDNEPRTLDTIIAEGFKRIDEAIEGVIAKEAIAYGGHIDCDIGNEYSRDTLNLSDRDAQRLYNYRLTARIERAAVRSRL